MKRKINWEKEYGKKPHWIKSTKQVEKIFKIIKKYKIQGRVLDIGCGTGEKTTMIAEKFDVVGIDVSKNAINQAKKQFPELKFEIGNAEKLRFKSNSFDLVLSINTLQFTNKEKSISEIRRVLKPKGIACLFIITQTISKNKETKDITNKIINIFFKKFEIIEKKISYSLDKKPYPHKHKKLMLVLRKD